ncbi:phosphotransferase family protein [Actinophytocola oryzae]|uniref:Aminoglycoside phosphotransferase (APT) family kinase protein n=1 Tax=Actinophytocola oryzae TaxID=502181 RepID=A0A4R7USA5_9PSEU|nr:phosphotransferase family protein [Actinophytocola oryzae]TDV37769.1 aminoglycoside phosphotransferase (APT) family kinase protein [Actinophytocola oryzae]
MTLAQAPPGIELPALRRYFHDHVPEAGGDVHVELITGRRSNLTYLVTDDRHRWVLRRPPLGPLTPTAHDMAREYRVVAALQGSGVPVPAPVALCEDADVLGVPFSVVSYVEGRVLRDGDDAERIGEDVAARCGRALADALAALHAIPYDKIGLGDFGRPDGYLERQLRRWRAQWERVATRDMPRLRVLHDRLVEILPRQRIATIVHGDYRLDNTILDRHDLGWIVAIVDWEMSTLGDPLTDLGLLQAYWDPVTRPLLGVRHAPSANPGFPTADQLAQRYAETSGRDIGDLRFYRALGYFKLAVIAEGIHRRHLAGATVGTGFEKVGRAAHTLVDAGLRTTGTVA